MNRFQLAIGMACAAGVLAAFTACVNQKAEVERYRKVLDGPNAKAATGDVQMPGGVLRLEDALRIANADNAQLQIAGEDYVQALIDKARAAETFLPSISFAPTMTRQEDFKFPNVGGSSASGGGGAGDSRIFSRKISAMCRSIRRFGHRWCAISMTCREPARRRSNGRRCCWICNPGCS